MGNLFSFKKSGEPKSEQRLLLILNERLIEREENLETGS